MDSNDNFKEMVFSKLDEEAPTNSEQIEEILYNTREQCEILNPLIAGQIKTKDEMIDKLHRELDYYKQDAADRFTEQLMKALIKVRKDMARILNPDKWNSLSEDDIKREYEYTFEDITDLLEQQNIDTYHTESGEPFNAAIHMAKVEVTDNPELDKTVKTSLEDGYKKGIKIIQPERVIVYQYKK